MLDFASSHDPLPHSCFSLWSKGVKSKLPVVTNRVSIPGSAFNDARSEMVQFFLQRYHHDFLAASCKGKVQMVAESNRLTSMVPCVDHHMHKKPRRASRASRTTRRRARASTNTKNCAEQASLDDENLSSVSPPYMGGKVVQGLYALDAWS